MLITPTISNGIHGNAGAYDGFTPVEPLTERLSGDIYRRWLQQTICGKVDLFFAGHDHDMQVLKSVPECGHTLFIVSGAGAKTRALGNPKRNPAYWQIDHQVGFFLVNISGAKLHIKGYIVDEQTGTPILTFEKTFQKRKAVEF